MVANSHNLPRLATALADAPVVERQHRVTRPVEPFREGVGDRLFGNGHPPGHDHAGAIRARVVPCRACLAATLELDLLPGGRRSVGRSARAHKLVIRSYVWSCQV